MGKGHQHPDLENAAVPPGVHGRRVQPIEQAQQTRDLGGGSPTSAVLGENEPRQREVVVLAEVLGVVT